MAGVGYLLVVRISQADKGERDYTVVEKCRGGIWNKNGKRGHEGRSV